MALINTRVRSTRRYIVRLAFPAILTLTAYPNVLSNLLEEGAVVSSCAAAAASGGLVLWVNAGSPPAGDADVHDRQVDVLLAAPLLAAATWLTVSFPRPPVTAALSNRGVISLLLFLTATSLLVLGTRFTLRLRWALPLPLLAMPALTGRPVLLVSSLVALLLLAVLPVARAQWRRQPHALTASRWSHARRQRLPAVRSAPVALVGAVGVLLAASSWIASMQVAPASSQPTAIPGPSVRYENSPR